MTSALHALETLDIAAAQTDADGRIRAATTQLGTLLGASAEALKGCTVADAMERAGAQVAAEQVYRLGNAGGAHWYRAEGRILGGETFVALTDVSAEHRALDELRHFYAARDQLLSDGKVGTWRYDPETEQYFFSSELSLGYEQSISAVPLAMLMLIQHPDDQARDSEIRDRITRDGGTDSAEMRYRESDGSWTHLLVHYRSGRRLPSGRYEMLGISQNVTPVAAARDEANQSSLRLKFALKAAQAGVYEFDYTTRTYWASQEVGGLLGTGTVSRIAGQPFMLLSKEDEEKVRAVIGGAEQGGPGGAVEICLPRDQADPLWVRLYYDIKSRDANGRPLLGVGLLLNIETQKRQERALADARQSAEIANRAKSEFLANMSHELRTPLNAILGFSEMIEQQFLGPVNAKYLEYVRDIQASGRHLLDLVNDVLDISKLEAGRLELHEEIVDVSALIEDCRTLLMSRATEGRVALGIEIGSNLPHLRADARSVKQVLLNLISNGLKFTPEGGRVSLAAKVDAGGAMLIAVADTGIGMAPREIEVALSPFGQVDSRLARKHQGTGLGLPICKSLVELHQGTLTVESAPGSGTRVSVRFPPQRTLQQEQRAAS